jgi:CDP-4-dehydro-6-deoxyglucose reductase
VNHQVTWIEEASTFDAADGETVLDAAVRAGVMLPSECCFGACGTCRVKLLSGSVRYDEMPPGLSEQEAAEGYALACQARATSSLVVSTDRPLASPVPAARHRASVVALEDAATHVVTLTLAIDGQERIAFRPGQYMHVHLGEVGVRSFSMASSPNGATVAFHIRRIEGGYFTGERLATLAVGDTLDVELPLGGFGYHAEDYRPIVMIATGTGIAPLYAMLGELLADPDRPPIALFWGGRTPQDLYLHDTLVALAAQHDDFDYTPVLSRADETWTGARGYVQQAVATQFPDLSEHAVYACGSPDMIASAKRAFAELGVSARYFYADGFTFQQAESDAQA